MTFFEKIVTKINLELLNFLSPFFEFLYRFPDKKYLQSHSDIYKSTILKTSYFDSDNHFLHENLKNNGIVLLKNFLNNERLQAVKCNYDLSMNKILHNSFSHIKITPKNHYGINVPYLEDEYLGDTRHLHTRNILKFNKIFLELVCSDLLLDIATQYFQKKVFINQIDSYRLLPFESHKYSSFQWHHDGLGKKLNMMILLTDVNQNGQKMTYLKGSHLKHRSFKECFHSRVSDTEINEILNKNKFNQIVECTGKAGDVFIFDANGFHSGNRNNSAIRDTIVIQFTAGRYLWSFDCPSDFKNDLDISDSAKKFMNNNIKINWI